MDKPVGHSQTPYGTPMHVSQLILLMLKATFADLGDELFPYRFSQDYEQTGIIIDTAFNKESGAYGLKPALVVARGPVSSREISIGDLAEKPLHNLNANKTALVNSSVEVRVISRYSGEVDMLSNEVFNVMLMCRSVFPEMMGLQRVDMPTMSPISTMEQDDKMYVSIAAMAFSMQYQWKHLIPQEVIANISLFINDEKVFSTEPLPIL